MRRAWAIGGLVVGAAVLASAYTVLRGSGDRDLSAPEDGVRTPLSNAGPLRVVLGERSSAYQDGGEVSRGGHREVPFVVSNTGTTAVTIGTIRVSCECLRVELDAKRVEAGGEVGGRAVIDLTAEPRFVGGLILEAEASAKEDSRAVFALRLSVQVK